MTRHNGQFFARMRGVVGIEAGLSLDLHVPQCCPRIMWKQRNYSYRILWCSRMIDPRLHTLRVLRQQGTVTAAAYALRLTPSTVSQQLKQLARELGVVLLEADGRRVRLTPAAEIVLRHADVLFAQWENARADLSSHADGDLGRLRICGVSSAVAVLIAPAAARLRDRHPRLETLISTAETHECFQRLLAGEADIAVVIPTESSPATGDPRFDQISILDEVQDLLVPAGHRLADRTDATLADAADEEWVGMPHNLNQHHLLTTAAASAGFVPRIRHEAGDWFSVSALVAHGFGVGLLPRMAPVPPQHAVVRVPLHGRFTPTRRIFSCVRRGSRHQPGIAKGLAALTEAAIAVQP